MNCAACEEPITSDVEYTISSPLTSEKLIHDIRCLERWIQQEKIRVTPTARVNFQAMRDWVILVSADLFSVPELKNGDRVYLSDARGLNMYGMVMDTVGFGKRIMYKIRINKPSKGSDD